MGKSLAQALELLSSAERRGLWTIVFLSAVAAVVQALAILAILPFILLLADPSIASANTNLVRLAEWLGTESYFEFLTVFGGLAIVGLLVGNAFLALEHWLSGRYLASLGLRLGTKAFGRVLNSRYAFFLTQSSSRLGDTILSQVERVAGGVLGQFIVVISNMALTAFVVLSLLLLSFQATLTTLFVLGALFLCVFVLLQRRIHRHGEELTELSGSLFGVVKETLDGIREIKVRNVETYFSRRFEKPATRMAELERKYSLISVLPNFALETLIFAGLVSVALYFIRATDDPGLTLSLIALYGIAAYRLVPAMQALFDGLAAIEHNADAVRVVAELVSRPESNITQRAVPALKKEVRFNDIAYQFPGADAFVLDGASVTIPAGSSLCVWGPSGSGKSTLLNLLVGLLAPSGGKLVCDDLPIGEEELLSWQSHIGFCPQNVFLFTGTLAENVAFGQPPEDLDADRLETSLQIANLRELYDRGRLKTVSERGKNVSGGQAQRIGIARALYHDPRLLVFDEAFSGLDAGNRDAILDALFELPGKTLVFASHDPVVAQRCDRIVTVSGGRIDEIDPADSRFGSGDA